MFVLVGGLPASGKSSLAASLAAELGFPLIAKDAIKEALMDVLGLPAGVQASRRLGRAAVMAMLTVARTSPGGVLDSIWYPYTLPVLRELQGPLIEVRCVVPVEVARRRYAERTLSRHAGHLDADRLDEELWDPVHARALGVGLLVEVDTTREPAVAELVERIRALAAGSSGKAMTPSNPPAAPASAFRLIPAPPCVFLGAKTKDKAWGLQGARTIGRVLPGYRW